MNTTWIVIDCIVTLWIVAILFNLWRKERNRRRDAEDDLVIEQLRGDLLHDQVPFPYGESSRD
jgi:hypothetical protein